MSRSCPVCRYIQAPVETVQNTCSTCYAASDVSYTYIYISKEQRKTIENNNTLIE